MALFNTFIWPRAIYITENVQMASSVENVRVVFSYNIKSIYDVEASGFKWNT
jgi:hypothetical protein